jgi:hypothetical protein
MFRELTFLKRILYEAAYKDKKQPQIKDICIHEVESQYDRLTMVHFQQIFEQIS